MINPSEILDHSTIYEVEDVGQFIIAYHPNDMYATVFMLRTDDYGKITNFYFTCKSEELEKIIDSSSSNYEAYIAIENFGKGRKNA